MAQATFTSNDDPFRELRDAFDRLQNPDRTELEPVSDAIRQGFAKRFAEESSRDGQKWAPLAKSTIKDRQREGLGEHPIHRRSDSLLDTFINPENPDHIAAFGTYAGEWVFQEGSADDRAVWLGEGTDTIPSRPMVELSDSDEELVGAAMDRVFDRIMGFF